MTSKEREMNEMPLLSRGGATAKTEVSVSHELYDSWRVLYIVHASLGLLALVPALWDYEVSYDTGRMTESCTVNQEHILLGRWGSLALSALAIVFLVLCRVVRIQWERHLPLLYTEMPSLKRIEFHELLLLGKAPGFWRYFDGRAVFFIVIYIVFPYPYAESKFYVSQTMGVSTEICYYLSEALYALMFLRVVPFTLALCNFGKYHSIASIMQCECHGVPASHLFALKCYMIEKPFETLLFFFVLPAVVVFGLLLRVFERPVTDSVFEHPANAFWNIVVTVTTVGYGDTFPVTLLGRFVVVLAIFWGGIILSLLFGRVAEFVSLLEKEKKAFDGIIVSDLAASAIVHAIRYSQSAGNLHARVANYSALRTTLAAFKEKRTTEELEDEDAKHLACAIESIQSELKSLHSKVDELNGKPRN